MIYYDAFVLTEKKRAIRIHDKRLEYEKSRIHYWVDDLKDIFLITLCYFLSFCGFAFSLYCLSRIGG